MKLCNNTVKKQGLEMYDHVQGDLTMKQRNG